MSTKHIVMIAAGALILLLLVTLLVRWSRRRVKPNKFRDQWQELQKFCASRETWPLAILTADKLLDEALKKRGLKGKSMGERLVSAQRQFSDNDGVWYAHNLSKKLIEQTNTKLYQRDVKRSLLGVGQALKDLGALVDDK